jgi:hypothetical protein
MGWKPKFSLATLVISVFATGTLTWMNFTPHGTWSLYALAGMPKSVKWYGWPLIACEWIDPETRLKIMAEKPVIFSHDYPIWIPGSILVDVVFFLVVVFLAGYLTECFVRRRFAAHVAALRPAPPSDPSPPPTPKG